MAEKEKIIITGICGRLGRILAKELVYAFPNNEIIGIDRRPFYGKPADITIYHFDIRKKKCENLFRLGNVQALIHLGIMHDPRAKYQVHRQWNILGTMQLLDYCQKYEVPKLILLSSANVYGTDPTNSSFLTEDAPLNASRGISEISDLVEVDLYTNTFFWRHPKISTIILRPVNIVGPTVQNAFTKLLRRKYIPVLLGFDPMLQLIHEDDVVKAIILALNPEVRGIFNLVGPGEIPLSAIIKELHATPIYVPHFFATPVLNTLWRFKVISAPPAEADFVKYACIVDGTRAKEILGFTPAYDLKETIASLKQQQNFFTPLRPKDEEF